MSLFQNPTALSVPDATGTGASALKYPHPFFDVATTYLPTTLRQLFRWCYTYYQSNGVISSVVNKMAKYPVTKIRLKTDSTQRQLMEAIFKDHLNLELFCIDTNVDYFVYGNAFISIHFPIMKYLECAKCGSRVPMEQSKVKFENLKFMLHCGKSGCGHVGEARPIDVYVPNRERIKLIRWDPQDVDIDYNPLTGDAKYIVEVPLAAKGKIRAGDLSVLATTPQVFIDAVAKNQRVRLSPDNIFHMRRESIVGKDIGWGQPLVMPALKDLYLMQVLKKSQEAVAHEHVIPLRIIHPASNGTVDPISTIDLGSWQSTMRAELTRWRRDPNYTPIVPQPIGFQYLGGQGKSLMLVNEIKQLAEMIVMAMEVPTSFAFGGMTFSGSSVDLRMMENLFMRVQSQNIKMVNFIIKSVCRFLNIPPCSAEFVSIKTADDVQRKQMLLNLAQLNKVSSSKLLAEFDIEPTEERKVIEDELGFTTRMESKQFLANAENQGQALLIQARYQNQAARVGAGDAAEGQPGAGQPLGDQDIQLAIQELKGLPPDQQQAALQQLQQYVDPESLAAIQEGLSGGAKKKKNLMRPQPDQKPPRRSAESASI